MMYISMDLLNSPTQHHSTWARTQICIEHVHNNFKVKIFISCSVSPSLVDSCSLLHSKGRPFTCTTDNLFEHILNLCLLPACRGTYICTLETFHAQEQ